MKKILMILLLAPTLVFAQAKFNADSLTALLNKPGLATARRIDILNGLTNGFLRNKNDQAEKYALKVIDELKHTKYPKGEAHAYRNLADIYSMRGNYDLAVKYVNRSLDVLAGLKMYDESGYVLCLKGNVLRRKKLSEASMQAYIDAIHNFEKDNCKDGLAKAYSGIAALFVGQKDYQKAIEYDKQALVLYTEAHDRLKTSITLGNLGIVELRLNHFDGALQYHFRALKAMQGLNDSSRIAYIYNDIGAAYLYKGDPKKAISYLKNSINIRQQIKQYDELAYTLNYLGEAYEKDGNLIQATEFIKQANALAKKTSNTKQILESYESISDFYSRHKIYDSAYVYGQKYKNYKDSVDVKESKQAMNAVRIQYETEKKEQQINLLYKENIIQKLSISNRNRTIGIIVVIFLLCVAMGLTIYNRFKSKQEARLQTAVILQQDIASKRIIEAEEAERKRIAGDLHDGVGQLFTTVKMNMEILMERFLVKQPDADQLAEKTMAMVDESCTEVRSIAHQMMPNALIKSGLVAALRDFINKIPAEKLKISMETKGIDKPLESTTETVLYRVIQESVNNVIKHANATSLDILLLCDANEITVSIEDNGRGFNTADNSKFTGIGLKNMISRVEYLKGSVDISSSPGKGTLVAIFIPLT
ncbi:MAG: sensor histidine kinase [Bacteroidota bacterium]